MSTQNEPGRMALGITGKVVVGVGILLILAGLCDEISAKERDNEWRLQNEWRRELKAGNRDFLYDIDGSPRPGPFMVGSGVFAIVIGLALVVISFQRAMKGYQMRLDAFVLQGRGSL